MKARSRFRALVFDFDGLVLDTESCVYESWRAVYAACVEKIKEEQDWLRQLGNGKTMAELLNLPEAEVIGD